MPATLRLILGDQLNQQHNWFNQKTASVTYLLIEARSETDYVRHHIQKIVGFFLAMRHFKTWLEEQGHQVIYVTLDDPENRGALTEQIKAIIATGVYTAFSYQLPDEYRLDQALQQLQTELPVPTVVVDSAHFLVPRNFLADLFAGKKTYLMETFYRKIRVRYQLLMEDDGASPLAGRWNFDAENRKKLPAQLTIPPIPRFPRQVHDLVGMVAAQGVATIGEINADEFSWPVTRTEGLAVLQDFCENRLPFFGTYQDAMTDRHPLLFHSLLSFVLNTKLLHPLEVVESVIAHWQKNQDTINLAQVEGFVRQIIGWREYMRGVYWAQMPNYASKNFFAHQADLPAWFWTGNTNMKCLQHAIGQSLEHAYAHHIQRLMVTGNFALLLGVDPDQLDEWYLGIYMDAIEWVEITNTRGMSQFADGGLLATKPYVASANYMHKMGDYCTKCRYNYKEKTGENACPFNSLYWDFMDRHRSKLSNNPRIGMAYRTWDRYDGEQKAAILQRADQVKKHVNEL
ncbi:MAG: cryptochrome/photolyase family protein [Bacteroidetes bacterium]|nr:MAG: cryptochrome/photolyase family protein [Bacteroidota bacterium]PTM13699.1 MAG: cryptochrome/photolyase family protein [Bacteroidota bacterium]